MKFCVILSTLVVISANICSAASNDEKVEVKSSYNEISGDSYKFGYELTDDQSRAEEGKLVQVGDKQVLRVTGSYSFIGDDGASYKVNYSADERGYKPMIKIIRGGNFVKKMSVMLSQMILTNKKKTDVAISLVG